MKIVYLYAELMPYQIIVFKELINNYNAQIIAIHWDKKKLTPYQLPSVEGVEYISRSLFKKKNDLFDFIKNSDPCIIVCSGWMDSFYNYVAKKMKKKGVVTIAISDTQWKGGRQWLNIIFSSFRQKKWFSFVWVAGIFQYEYAKKLGFKNKEIIYNSLTTNVSLFSSYGKNNLKVEIPHNFVYIGNFRFVKGTDILIKAFRLFKQKEDSDWKLICIGNGDMKELSDKDPDITWINFKNQDEICKMSNKFGVFILPSRSEQWGLVLHEAACLGLPIISSDTCGGNSTFLIDGYNGFSFTSEDVNSLVEKMLFMSQLQNSSLKQMRENSYSLSNRITPSITAASLVSVIKNNDCK